MKKNKVLVTGGCGFIGREVVKQLLEKDYHVVVVDDLSNSTSLEESPYLDVIKLDLRNPTGIYEILDGIDYCIHLAARVGGIKYMSAYQSEILRDDILIDTNIISAASQINTKIVYASTVIIYDQLKESPFKEDQINILPPKSNYGFSKFIGERLCQVFGQDRNLKFVIARISNVYGININEINEEKLHVIPDLIRKISADKKLQLINGGGQFRSFVHVSDLARALISMMENKDSNGQIFNVATRDRYQILELAKMIWSLLKPNEIFSFESVNFKGQDLVNSFADTSKINKVLNWKAKKNLKDNLPEIVRWYKNKYEKKVS